MSEEFPVRTRKNASASCALKYLGCGFVAAYLIASMPMLVARELSSNSHKIKIVLVGDSTVTDKSGWGLGFKACVKNEAECINTSAGGRSSKSFLDEGKWTNALALHGDYYLIQFGHNNEPGKPGRSTDMETFVANMKQYVDDARAIGAKPLLITPLARRQWDKSHEGKINSSLQPYAEAVERIAVEKKVPLLDLHSRSIELCEKLGVEGCKAFSPSKETDGTNRLDNTHLNTQGSFMFANLVVLEIKKHAPDLAGYLQSAIKPTSAIGDNKAAESKTDAGADTVKPIPVALPATPGTQHL
jgi:pectinesterase